MRKKTKYRHTESAWIKRIVDILLRLISEPPDTNEGESRDPNRRTREIARRAALKAALVSGGLALPPGWFGWITLVPDLHQVWRIQRQMVVDIAAAFGKKAFPAQREVMLYCLFKHTSSHFARDIFSRVGERVLIRRASIRVIQQILKRVGIRITQRIAGRAIARWIPVVGGVGVGWYAYYDTMQVAANAIDLFSRKIEYAA